MISNLPHLISQKNIHKRKEPKVNENGRSFQFLYDKNKRVVPKKKKEVKKIDYNFGAKADDAGDDGNEDENDQKDEGDDDQDNGDVLFLVIATILGSLIDILVASCLMTLKLEHPFQKRHLKGFSLGFCF
ncbi:hypothetical protein BDA99DRAFT_535500 [Phascolomyces articulosus]|uniref:Uncharacterized protein n=1 Tax=Phascolomyces articulosus TaxID=60185 RepID=A0AAD5KDK7_9FUNG|nr:hypothetical protein BDA99DRAFT_535500 [Phascolomyces articulosus]